MPMVQVKLIEGVFTEMQKQEMVQKLTDAMVSLEGGNLRDVTWAILDSVKGGNRRIGGQALTAAPVKALSTGKPVA